MLFRGHPRGFAAAQPSNGLRTGSHRRRTPPECVHRGKPAVTRTAVTDHLDRLEAESLHILREVAAESRRPVMLYSIGKDSSVLLHLLLKAFAPATPPIPLLHVDTTWKFREMIARSLAEDQRSAISAVAAVATGRG